MTLVTAARRAVAAYRQYIEDDDLETLRLAMTDLEEALPPRPRPKRR